LTVDSLEKEWYTNAMSFSLCRQIDATAKATNKPTPPSTWGRFLRLIILARMPSYCQTAK